MTSQRAKSKSITSCDYVLQKQDQHKSISNALAKPQRVTCKMWMRIFLLRRPPESAKFQESMRLIDAREILPCCISVVSVKCRNYTPKCQIQNQLFGVPTRIEGNSTSLLEDNDSQVKARKTDAYGSSSSF